MARSRFTRNVLFDGASIRTRPFSAVSQFPSQPIPGKRGGRSPQDKPQALDSSPKPAAHRRGIGHAIGVGAIRRRIFGGRPISQSLQGLLPGQQAVNGARHTFRRKNCMGAPALFASSTSDQEPAMRQVMGLSPTAAVADHRFLLTNRTTPGQPIHVYGAGVASLVGKWDKYDHSRRESASWSRTRPRHTAPWRRFRSYVSHSKLKRNHGPGFLRLAAKR